MNSLDLILIIIISLITIRGIFRGLINELVVLVALFLGFIVAFLFLSTASGFLIHLFPAISPGVAKIISFIVLFIGVNIAIRLTGKVLNKLATFTFLQPVNKLAGGLFAFGKSVLIISIVFMIIDFLPFSQNINRAIGVGNSSVYEPVKAFAPLIYNGVTMLAPNSDQLQKEFMHTIQKADSTSRDLLIPR